jgi:SAM-dependent methyltransferase
MSDALAAAHHPASHRPASHVGGLPPELTLPVVQAFMGRHIPLYRRHPPTYQLALLRAFRAVMDPVPTRLLDVGGGTGIIAQAMKDLIGIPHVVTVDVVGRFLPSLDVPTQVYDGATLPFADGAFEAVTLSNVMHHVPVAVRPGLMRECARVTGGGPIYIKDHVAASRLDHGRLTVLDALGNVPFGGMVTARYLTEAEWQALAAAGGYRIDARVGGTYRAGPFAAVFPNRLETTLRLTAA